MRPRIFATEVQSCELPRDLAPLEGCGWGVWQMQNVCAAKGAN